MTAEDSRRNYSHPDDLTWREQEILALLGERLTNKEIAGRLHLAESTIKDYVSRILKKLYVNNRREAVAKADDLGLLTRDRPEAGRPVSGLPHERTPFVGREIELTQITDQLKQVRLLSLTGPGGIGKTRLAVKAADRLRDRFLDGCFFIALTPLRSEESLIQAIAEGIQHPIATQEPPMHQLLRYLRSRSMLLVLDNFEHLLTGAGIVSQILEEAPGISVLVTSRERLNLSSEVVLTIGGMDLQAEGGPSQSDAIKLFIQGAHRVLPDFEPTSEDQKKIALICRSVGGMPLAIELAAAWLRVLTLEEISNELELSLDFLSTEVRDTPERHRSIRTIFNHSWNMLDKKEQYVFLQLSIFRGGFTREAATAIVNANLNELAGLVDKSLLHHEPITGRFESHELLRQYAVEKLEQDPEAYQAAMNRHGQYYASFMEERWNSLHSSYQKAALLEIEADIENVRAAWEFFLTERNVPMLWHFIYALWYFYHVRWWNQPGMVLFRNAAIALEGVKDSDALAIHYFSLTLQSYFMAWLESSAEGYEIAHRCSEEFEILGRPELLVFALYSKSVNAYFQYRFTEMIKITDRMLLLTEQIDDPWLRAFTLFAAGLTHISNDNFEKARELAKENLVIYEELEDDIGKTTPLIVLGHAALGLGELESARGYYLRCLNLSLDYSYYYSIQTVCKYMAKVALAMNNLEDAEVYLKQALEITNEIGFVRDIVNLVFEYARLFSAKGDLVTAVQLLSLVIQHPVSDRYRMLDGCIRESAESLLFDVKNDMIPEDFDLAVMEGKLMDLDDVTRNLIS